MNIKFLITRIGLPMLLVAGLLIGPLQRWATAATPTVANNTTASGNYSGLVKLVGTARGVYSDTLTANVGPDLGTIELALQLNQANSNLTGYVDLGKTLVFSTEHTLTGTTSLSVGPYLTGSFDGTTLHVESEQVSDMLAGRNIKRQFRLIGTLAADTPNTLRGEYRETLWGYARQPITVIGTVVLNRATIGTQVANPGNTQRVLYLPMIRR